MQLKEIFLYEFRYQLRNISTYALFIVFLAISFLIINANYVPDAIMLEFYVNSPFIIASVTVVTIMFWLLISPSIAGEAAARDIYTRMYSLVYTSPVSKMSYLGGKFLAAFLINSLIMLAIPIGIIIGTYTSGLDENLIGPFRVSAYLTSYFFIALPNIFLATAAQFMCAVILHRAVASYLAGLAVYIGSYVVSFTLGNLKISAILDPMSYNHFISTVQNEWTPIELNNRLVALEGLFLVNRLLWIGVGMSLLIIAYCRFKFSYLGSSRKEKNKHTLAAHERPIRNLIGVGHFMAPVVFQSFNFTTKIIQILAIASSSLRAILRSRGGFIILFVVSLLALLVVNVNMDHQDVPLLADSWRVLIHLTAPLGSVKIPWIFIVILIAFYAGELIWRERETRLNDVYDATPTSDWVLFSGKFLALAAFLIIFILLLIIVGISAQLLLGNYNINLLLYLKILFGMQLIDYLIFALLACFVHIVVNQKYIGHFVVLLAFGFVSFASILGIENKLLIFGSDSGWSYTAMQGFSDLKLWVLFKLYWIGWTILFAVIAKLLWVRGRDFLFNKRYSIARGRMSRSVAGTSLVGITLIFISGGFIFYNTRVLNTYQTAGDIKAYKAEYEKLFGHFRNAPKPSLIKSNLAVDIFPDQRKLDIAGTYHLLNHNSVPIDSIHIHEVVEVSKVAFDQSADLVHHDEDFGYRIYKLHKPVQPGDSLKMKFQLSYLNDDLSGKNASKHVIDNGSFFRNYQVLPSVGYQFLLELNEKSDREAFNLSPRPEVASLDNEAARSVMAMWDWKSMVEAVVSTDEGQIAVGPGKLQDSWSEGGRRYFKYATNAPIRSEFSFFSADYAIYQDHWKGVDIQVYHHPEHTRNLEVMVAGIKKSLEYFSDQFGPYPYDQLRFIERPSTEFGLHAAPVNIDYSEGFSYMDPATDERELDFVFAIVAHEMAHQWWGNQLRYARVEGGGILSESLAWYSAMKLVENVYSKQTIRELLALLRKEYDLPKSRADVPLIRGNGFFQLYRKGPLALYTISEYIGEDCMNKALRSLFEKHGKGQPPLATTMDLYNEIAAVTPDSMQYLVHDLFMENTFWDFEMEDAVTEKTSNGDWKVTLQIDANKEVVDEIGIIKKLQMDDWIEIGVYGLSKADGSGAEILHLQKYKIKSGQQTIVIIVPEEPGQAGIDPNQLLDRNVYDNFGTLSEDKFVNSGAVFN